MIPTLHGRAERDAQPTPVTVRKVLVVDEAAPVRRSLLEMLHRLGIPTQSVFVEHEAETALEVFVREHPTLVFTELLGDDAQKGLDMVLEMLGIDPHVKVVLVTAEPSDSPLVRRAVRAGVFAVVEKPLRHDKVRAVLTELDNEVGGVERYR